MIEDIERQEDEQERKRVRIEGKIQQHRSNLTEEEKRNWILAEATKRMQGISDTKTVFKKTTVDIYLLLN